MVLASTIALQVIPVQHLLGSVLKACHSHLQFIFTKVLRQTDVSQF